MQIEFFGEDVKLPDLNFSIVKDWVSVAIENEKYTVGDINFIYCSDEYLLKINKQYLEHDFFTDVITFDYCEDSIVSGDIFMSLERIIENSKIYSDSIKKELLRIIIHGVLHLVGFNDKTNNEKLEMTKKENFYLELFNKIENPK